MLALYHSLLSHQAGSSPLNRLQHILFVVIAFGISCFWKIAVEDEGRGRHLSHTQPFLLSAVLGVIVVTLIWLLAGKSVYQVVINQFMVDSVFQPVTQWFLTFGLLSAVAMIPYNKMRKRIPAHLTPVNYIAIHAISFVAMVSVMVALYFQVTI